MEVLEEIVRQAKTGPKKIVFPEGFEPRVIRSLNKVIDQGIASEITLLGEEDKIKKLKFSFACQLCRSDVSTKSA